MDSLSSLKLKPCRGMISTFSLHCKSHLKQNPGREILVKSSRKGRRLSPRMRLCRNAELKSMLCSWF
ncbi:hypothetical protein I3842_08G115500 [Carya illinoinensis]|uniref:Uncharacterized protein n=1 Tax=Carya illinoinensis TaxID=32201 RepID=A0A922JC18_CARIL|nr:hypothetical protein I3842_08G115500 [Carya illinoinensis]